MTSHNHTHALTGINQRKLVLVLSMLSVVFVAQVVGAIVSGSLALLADTGHMLTDLIGISVALIASVIATRPPSANQTFGYQRVEVFAALMNGLILLGVAVFVVIEAISRLTAPNSYEPLALPMLIIGLLGLAANLAALLILRPSSRQSLNMRGAYLEVFGDALGSIAVVASALIIWATGFWAADAIASLVIAALIVPRALSLLRDVFRVLSQATPAHIEVDEIRAHLATISGVVDVHDVHVWSMTSEHPIFTAHVVVDEAVFSEGRIETMLDALDACLHEHFDVAHSTFQLEPPSHAAHESDQHR